MSAQSSRMPDDEIDAPELFAGSAGVWRAKGCHGCGEAPKDVARIDAIAVTALLQRRFALLLDNPEHSLRHRGPGRGSWSAMEPAAQVSDVLGTANSRLRVLLGEETLEAVPMATETGRSLPTAQTLSAVSAALAANVGRLTATISGATSEDWRRREAHDGITAGELVWRALHDATHHLEDAELLLDAASQSAAPRSPITDIHARSAPPDWLHLTLHMI